MARSSAWSISNSRGRAIGHLLAGICSLETDRSISHGMVIGPVLDQSVPNGHVNSIQFGTERFLLRSATHATRRRVMLKALSSHSAPEARTFDQIGRASCRERV